MPLDRLARQETSCEPIAYFHVLLGNGAQRGGAASDDVVALDNDDHLALLQSIQVGDPSGARALGNADACEKQVLDALVSSDRMPKVNFAW